jgi:GR25 family glycosyltransferase involved in LPS biosynthesis
MKFQDIPKFVVNLETRPDNLELIKKEMDYMGWEFEKFNAINRNSYMGCTLSHLGIIQIAKERGYDRVMVIEDDCVFMPYAKSLLDDIEKQIDGIEFGVLNITPTLNRKLNLSDKYDLLLDITNTPPKENEVHTETFATNILIYDKSVYDEMFNISLTAFTTSGDYYFPIDGYLVNFIYPKFQSYCPILPIAPQRKSYSDVSHGMYNNFYAQTYNWNVYSPKKLPNEFKSEEGNEKIKEEKKHIPYYVG